MTMTTGEGAEQVRATGARRAVVMAIVLNALIVAIGVVMVVTEEAMVVRLLGGLFAVVAAVSVGYFVRRLRGGGSPRRFENDREARMTLVHAVLRLAVLLLFLLGTAVF